jgi:hypothetical protein
VPYLQPVPITVPAVFNVEKLYINYNGAVKWLMDAIFTVHVVSIVQRVSGRQNGPL